MSFVMLEFVCDRHDPPSRFESLERRPAPDATTCPHCGELAERVISAAKSKTVWCTAVSTGKSDPPPSPMAMDTRPIADGMSKREWQAKRRAMWRDHDRAEFKRKGGL